MDLRRATYAQQLALALAATSPGLARFHATRAHRAHADLIADQRTPVTDTTDSTGSSSTSSNITTSRGTSDVTATAAAIATCARCGSVFVPGVSCSVRTIRVSTLRAADIARARSSSTIRSRTNTSRTSRTTTLFPLGRPRTTPHSDDPPLWLRYTCRACGTQTIVPTRHRPSTSTASQQQQRTRSSNTTTNRTTSRITTTQTRTQTRPS